MRSEHLLLAALLTTAALGFAPDAQAFCRTTTTPAPPDFQPSIDGCFTQGLPLYHQSLCVPYHLLTPESRTLPTAVLSNAIASAFTTWSSSNATCSPGITGIELAPVHDVKIVDYKTGERTSNVFGVVQGPWPHAGGSETLSLATLTFNATTGEIYDADLEIREDLPWSSSGVPRADAYDLQAVMTHEVGHILGLAHSSQADAIMFASYTPGSTSQRTLTPDDAHGICAVYPDRQSRVTGSGVIASTACDLSPAGPATPPGTTCGAPVVTHGCGIADASPHDGAWLASLGILGALAWRSRSRRPRV